MIAVDILCPIGKPGDCLVVDDRLPVAGDVRFGNRNAFSNVDGDIFWSNSVLNDVQ